MKTAVSKSKPLFNQQKTWLLISQRWAANKEGVDPHVMYTDPRKTIFARIVNGEVPSKKLHEDDLSLVIEDLNPQAPTHLLILPKKPVGSISEAKVEDAAMLGHLMLVGSKVAKKIGISEGGYRMVINNVCHDFNAEISSDSYFLKHTENAKSLMSLLIKQKT